MELVGPGRVFVDDLRDATGTTVIADDSGRDMDVRMADADLIAAAPEMLALLREAAEAMDRECSGYGEMGGVQRRIEAMLKRLCG